MALILGIESTCDETAASIVEDGARVRSNVISTQVDLHRVYKGVVPEIASRAHIENILPVIQQATAQANCDLQDIHAIAVAQRPGLIGSLLIGVTAAKTLSWALSKPLVGVDHVQAHLYSVVLKEATAAALSSSAVEEKPDPFFPAIGLVCSGGHTALYHLQGWTDVMQIGHTIDDAVGEAYDKVAAIMNLGYPGGPVIDRLSAAGDPEAIDFPRSRLNRDSLDFSFSGLKTSVLYHLRGFQGRARDPSTITQQEIHNVCASFQQACIDILRLKIKRAVGRYDARSIIIGGGVSANRGLRNAMADMGLPVYFPAIDYCTDNAAMIAGLGGLMFQQGLTSDLSMDAITSGSISPAPSSGAKNLPGQLGNV